jgi:hypothetical protein
MDADIEKKEEPSPGSTAPREDYGQIVSTRERMGRFARIIDGFRQNPKCVLAELHMY